MQSCSVVVMRLQRLPSGRVSYCHLVLLEGNWTGTIFSLLLKAAGCATILREDHMQLGMIGLGRMGANMVRRLMRNGHECVVFDRSAQAVGDLVKEKATGADSL